MTKKNIVVVGAGKGLGNAVAKIFGKNDFRVILVSRNIERLNGYKTEFEKDTIETYVYPADCEKPQTLKKFLMKFKINLVLLMFLYIMPQF